LLNVDDESPKPQPEITETKDWLVEDFPVDLRWRCKKAASHRRAPLKKFVQDVMRKAVEQIEAEMLHSAHEGREKEIRHDLRPIDTSPARKTVRGTGRKKA
jgi:hypothetical protein